MYKDVVRSVELPISSRVEEYLPSADKLTEYQQPGTHEKWLGSEHLKDHPGSVYAFQLSPEGKGLMVPPWHNLNLEIISSPGPHYGQVAFEGDGMEPVVNDNGEIIGANIVLLEPRMARFGRSIRSLGITWVDGRTLETFKQGILDQAAVLGEDVLRDKSGNPSRAYIRPAAYRMGKLGVSPNTDDRVRFDSIMQAWGPYLPLEAYRDGAVVDVYLDIRRESAIRGKVAGNYSHAGEIGLRARKNGAHEAIILGPYWVDPKTGEKRHYDFDSQIAMEQALTGGVLADGPGEDTFFFSPEGGMLLQPADTNILGGTTRTYVRDSLSPALGINSIGEKPVTIADVRERKVVAGGFVGNAVKISPIRQLNIRDSERDLVETLQLDITPQVEKLRDAFVLELTGRVKTSGDLLTPVDLEEGKKARNVLDEAYKNWIF